MVNSSPCSGDEVVDFGHNVTSVVVLAEDRKVWADSGEEMVFERRIAHINSRLNHIVAILVHHQG